MSLDGHDTVPTEVGGERGYGLFLRGAREEAHLGVGRRWAGSREGHDGDLGACGEVCDEDLSMEGCSPRMAHAMGRHELESCKGIGEGHVEVVK